MYVCSYGFMDVCVCAYICMCVCNSDLDTAGVKVVPPLRMKLIRVFVLLVIHLENNKLLM